MIFFSLKKYDGLDDEKDENLFEKDDGLDDEKEENVDEKDGEDGRDLVSVLLGQLSLTAAAAAARLTIIVFHHH